MITPTSDDQISPGQTWRDERGDTWEITGDYSAAYDLFLAANRSFRQRTGGICQRWCPSTPPPGWRRLLDGHLPDLDLTPIQKRRLS